LHAAHQIDDQDMKGLMIDMGDRCYDFLTELCATWTALRGERSLSPHRHLFTHGAKVIDLK
jgi:hypothetical protein